MSKERKQGECMRSGHTRTGITHGICGGCSHMPIKRARLGVLDVRLVTCHNLNK